MSAPCFAALEPCLQRVRADLAAMALGQPGLVGRLARYALQKQGQMLRPSLIMVGALVTGRETPPDSAIQLGSLVELIHAASLLHDDVVDEGRFRRQTRTINEKWGNKEAVLLGDFLLAKALEILARFPDEKILGAVHRITLTLSTGELLELENDANLDLSEENYLAIISQKTASFFAQCCHLGGLVAGAKPAVVERLTSYGQEIGVAYQILDDLLDVVGSEQRLGKDTAHDALQGQITLPIIHALGPASSRKAREDLRASFERSDHDYVRTNLARIVREVGSYDYCIGRARVFARRAQDALGGIKGPGTRRVHETLMQFTDYIFTRMDDASMEAPAGQARSRMAAVHAGAAR